MSWPRRDGRDQAVAERGEALLDGERQLLVAESHAAGRPTRLRLEPLPKDMRCKPDDPIIAVADGTTLTDAEHLASQTLWGPRCRCITPASGPPSFLAGG